MATVLTRPDEPSTRRKLIGLSWVAIWLVFLGSPIEQIWRQDASTVTRLVGVAVVCLFAVAYLVLFVTARMSWRSRVEGCRPPAGRIAVLFTILIACVVGALPLAQETTLIMLVYVGAAALFTFPTVVGVASVLGLAAVAETAARLVPGWESQQWSASLSILFAGAAVYAARLASKRNLDLAAAREEMAQMAVAEERSRMTRDLHDILGHSLTVITVKAELASRLVGADEVRATAEIADIERLAREALTDVRATIAGRREVSLAPELVNARASLAAADIDAEVPNAVDDVPASNRELFAWTVREGVTNVLRHSKASHCVVRLSRGCVEIHDDGVGAAPGDLEGSGLRGLRERVSAAGAAIRTGTSPLLGGFLLEVEARADG